MDPLLTSLFFVFLVAAVAPIAARLTPGQKIPAVVYMLIGGIIIGPEVLNLAAPTNVDLMSTLGLSFLFLLAGYELDPDLFSQTAGKLGNLGWGISVVLSLGVTGLLYATGLVTDFWAIAIALTTTALGTLLPILREAGMLQERIGPYVMAAGAAGEFLPVIAMALLVGATGPVVGLLSLLAIVAATAVVLVLLRLVQTRGWSKRLDLQEESTGQTTLRWTMVILVGLVALASDIGLDVVLGAFLAGVVLRRWGAPNSDTLPAKLDAVGYGVFIPVFFVASGMDLDIDSILAHPERLLLFLVLMVAVRGLPALLLYRRRLDLIERWQMVFMSATALPLLVALSAIGLQTHLMKPENAAALVGAGAASVLLFPWAALSLETRRRRRISAGEVAA